MLAKSPLFAPRHSNPLFYLFRRATYLICFLRLRGATLMRETRRQTRLESLRLLGLPQTFITVSHERDEIPECLAHSPPWRGCNFFNYSTARNGERNAAKSLTFFCLTQVRAQGLVPRAALRSTRILRRCRAKNCRLHSILITLSIPPRRALPFSSPSVVRHSVARETKRLVVQASSRSHLVHQRVEGVIFYSLHTSSPLFINTRLSLVTRKKRA